jgi:hypothetical protein
MGGYDIFYSTLLPGGGWSVPKNIGYPLNTTDDDIFYDPVNKGFEGYFAKESPGGFGKQDIYRIEVFSADHPRTFIVRGNVKVGDQANNVMDTVKISILNIKDPGQTVKVQSEPKTGKYEFQLPQGNYQVVFENKKSEKVIKNLDLPLTYPADSFVLPDIILPGKDNVADLNPGDNKTKPVVKGDSNLFPVKTEPKSLQTVDRRQAGDSLGASENKRIIADKLIAAFARMLINRADDKLRKIITDADIESRQFSTVDDLLDFLKKEASGKNISPEEFDILALKVAVMDNILSQAAVDLLAKYTDGDLKRILSGLNIYKSNLKTWTDLLEYIESKTGGKITARELNKISGDILAGVDRSISRLREKILAYCDNSEAGDTLRKSVAASDLKNIKLKEKWLQEFYNESIKQGLTHQLMSDMLAAISSVPGTKAEQFLSDLTDQSEEPLLSSLKSIDLDKENINSPKDLLLYLLTNKDKVKYPEEAVYKAIANLIIAKDIPSTTIAAQSASGHKSLLWILWVILGTGLCIVFFLFRKRRRSKKK